MKKRVVRKAKFPRLRELREDLGMEVAEIGAKLGGKPSIATIYRLEQGQAIRVAHARKIFDLLNADGKLDPKRELKIE
jgi:transcriptional regulator with XRE-family HTH domain